MLRFAGFEYWDRTGPLQDGTVSVDGFGLEYLALAPPALGRRLNHDAEFEAGELWAASFIAAVADGSSDYVGIPVFPARCFRHGYVFVNTSSGIRRPEDLAGARVGVPEYSLTAAVWVRAFLQHDHGVEPSAVRWHVGTEVLHATVEPPGVEIRSVEGGGAELEELLLAGGLDALVTTRRPRAFLAGDPRVARLFPNHRQAEEDYFRRTGFFPIMHVIGVRRDVLEAHSGVASALMRAFEEAKRIGNERLHETGAPAVGLPWITDELERQASVLGPDPYPYGFRANRAALVALATYALEQGVVSRMVEPEELFAPELLDT